MSKLDKALSELSHTNTDYKIFREKNSNIIDFLNLNPDEFFDDPRITNYYIELSKFKRKLATLLKRIYEESIVEDFFFFDCPFSVYEKSYPVREKKFMSDVIDALPIHFAQHELQKYRVPYDYRTLNLGENELFNYSAYTIYVPNMQYSLDRKLQFLDKKMKKLQADQKPSGIIANQEDTVSSIFIDEKALDIFNKLLEYLGIQPPLKDRDGSQARLFAIWELKECRERFFKKIRRKEYVIYLNNRFGSTFNNQSTSDGSNHHENIKRFLTLNPL